MNQPVHILGPQFSNFVRSVQLCCEEKGISYTLGFDIDGEPVEFHGSQHYALHPFGKVPVLLQGERRLYETGSICRYLDAAFDGPALMPEDAWQRAQVDQWCAVLALYVDQALIRNFILELVFPKGEEGSVRMDKVEAAKPEVLRMLMLLDEQLGKGEFLVGEQFSMADIFAVPMLDFMLRLPLPVANGLMKDFPRLERYVERLRERASGKKVLIDAKIS